jgi:hypothetical protein
MLSGEDERHLQFNTQFRRNIDMDTKNNRDDGLNEDRFKRAPPADNFLGSYRTTIADTTLPIMLKLGVLGEDGHGSVGFTIRWLWLQDLCDQCGCDQGDVLDQFAEKMMDLNDSDVLDVLPPEMRDVSVSAALDAGMKHRDRVRRTGRARTKRGGRSSPSVR